MAQPEIVARWLDVWDGSLDLNAYLGLFAENVEFRDAQSGRVGRGRAELAEVARPFTQLSETSVSLLRYATNANEVFLEVELNAKAPSGGPVKSRGVVIFAVDDSEISSLAAYMFRQYIDV